MTMTAQKILVSASAACAGLLAFLGVTGVSSWTPPDAQVPGETAFQPVSIVTHRVPVDELKGVVERPLFSPERKPWVVEKAVVPEADPFANVQVLGLFGSTESGGALLRIDGKVSRVKYGDMVGKWKLLRVVGGHAEFEAAGDAKTTLVMKHLPQGGAAPAAPSAPPVTPPPSAPPAAQEAAPPPPPPPAVDAGERMRRRAARAEEVAKRAREEAAAARGQ